MLQYITCAFIIFLLCAVCQYYIMKKAGLQAKMIGLVLGLSLVLIVLFPKFLYYYGWFGIFVLYIAAILIVLSVGYRMEDQVVSHAGSIGESDEKAFPEVNFFRFRNALLGLMRKEHTHNQEDNRFSEVALKYPGEQSDAVSGQIPLDLDEEEREVLSSALQDSEVLNSEYAESLTDEEITEVLYDGAITGELASLSTAQVDLNYKDHKDSELLEIEFSSSFIDNESVDASHTSFLLTSVGDSEVDPVELEAENISLDFPQQEGGTLFVEIGKINIESDEPCEEMRNSTGIIEASNTCSPSELETIEDLNEVELNTVAVEADVNDLDVIQNNHELIKPAGFDEYSHNINQELQWLQDFIELGFAALSAGLEDAAMNYFQRALEITVDPDLAFMIVREISRIHVNAGRYDEAIYVLSYTMDRWADNPQSLELKRDILWYTYIRDILMKAGIPGVPLSRVPRFLRIKVDEMFRNKLMEG